MVPLDLVNQCAPQVAPSTIMAIIQVESANHPLAVHINGHQNLTRYPTDIKAAAQLANAEIKKGHSVDLGLMQINSEQLNTLGYSVTDMFNPCLNIKAGAAILASDYQKALQRFDAGAPALRAALSAYNTGNFSVGFTNGYIDKYSMYFVSREANHSSISITQPAQIHIVETNEDDPYTASTTVYQLNFKGATQDDNKKSFHSSSYST